MTRWRRVILTTVCLIATNLAAGGAQPAPPRELAADKASQTVDSKSACPYRPGAPYTADIHIGVSDPNTPPDSADVHLSGVIPGDGRQDAAARYVAALPVQPVRLRDANLKYFAIAPHVIVERPGSADCQLDVQVMISGRSPAFATHSNFTFETTVHVDGRTETRTETSFISCFDQDTPIRLASGQTTPVKDLVVGDQVWNPLLKRGVSVRAVIQGTQAGETLYRIGDDDGSVLFTGGHPLMTRRGEVTARRVAAGDDLLGADGRYHRVTVDKPIPGDPARLVYNLILGDARSAAREHWMLVGGLVAGDFTLQEVARLHPSSPR